MLSIIARKPPSTGSSLGPPSVNISVIIPTYNRAHLLERTLGSVQAQTLAPAEIILVDDGSTDNTATLVQQHFSDCRYLHQSNQGVSSARNHGIRTAKGEWLAFLDSDDEWLPGKLAAQRGALESAPEIRVCHTEEIWVRNGRRVNPMKKHAKTGGHIFQHCLPLCAISPSSVMIHHSIFDEVGLFDESLPACEDYDLWLRVCARHAVQFIDTPQIVKYGGHEDQLSHHYWGMDRFRIQALEKIIADPKLCPENRQAAIATLVEKAGIFAQGAEKRGKWEQAAVYREKQHRYQQQAQAAASPL
jgi:glycosyltransferase involved in cell wall biosynthesis